jgi:lipopolysaccharide export system permease protein
MQILWRYLISQYTKVFTLCVVAFVVFLLVMRMKETAEFAALGAPFYQLLLYALHQIPFILPIAIPISCLISSLLLMQRLSHSQELVALRSCGYSLKQILTPILTGAVCLSFLNFYLISEVSPSSLLATKKMIQNLSTNNPLLLLQNSQFLKFKDIYIQIDPLEHAQTAHHAFFFTKEKKSSRINLFYANSLEVLQGKIKGNEVSLIFHLPTDDSAFDHLIIDNHHASYTPVDEFIQLLKDNRFRIPYDHLQLSLLLIQKESIEKQLSQIDGLSQKEIKNLKMYESKCYYEVMKRFSLGFAPLTFTLLGSAYGINLGRSRARRNIFIVMGFAVLSCTAFFLAKSSQSLWFPGAMLFAPQFLMICTSIWYLNRCSKGVE